MTINVNESLMKGMKPAYECPDGFIIAGGAIRRWYSGEPQKSDIDLFCADRALREKWIEEHKGSLLSASKMNSTFRVDGKLLQVITIDFDPSDLNSLFNQFDYHHCCWSYNREQIFTTVEGLICTERKHLALFHPQLGYEMDTLRRAFKYQRAGYTPCAGTLLDLARMLRSIPDDTQVQMQIEISPDGGKRTIRFD